MHAHGAYRSGPVSPHTIMFPLFVHQLDVCPLPQVLHGLPEHCVIHKFEKVLEAVGGLFPQLAVEGECKVPTAPFWAWA